MFKLIATLTTLLVSLNFSSALADDNVTIIAPTSEVADGLNLYAVSEIFKEAANLEQFESDLNNPNYGINNLDLDGNGQVDFIRVVEEVNNDTHIIILQAIIWEDEFHDVATIEIETNDDNYNMHVHGNEVIYGSNYYIAPSPVRISSWPIMVWISQPVYRPYHSAYNWKRYPSWWKSHHPLLSKSYQLKTYKYKKRNTFVISRVARVKKVTRVKYKPRTSVRVTKHVNYKKNNHKVNSYQVNRKKTTKTSAKREVLRQNAKPNKTTTVTKTVTRTPNNKKTNTTVIKTTKKTNKSKDKKDNKDNKKSNKDKN